MHLGQVAEAYKQTPENFVREAPPQSNHGSSRQFPLWKAWCRPQRRRYTVAKEEHLYIVREDGCVGMLTVEDGSYSTHHVGTLPSLVEDAFNHDGRHLDAPDGIVCCGSLSDGGIFEVCCRAQY